MQLAVLTRQIQPQLVRQLTTGRQWLLYFKPLEQLLEPHVATRFDARGRLAGRARCHGLAPDRTAEQASLDVICAEPLRSVVPEVAAKLLEAKRRLGNPQCCIAAGEIHDDPRGAFTQRNLQIQSTIELPLPLPPREDLSGADWRFLQQLQRIRQTAAHLSLDGQLRHFPTAGVGNIGCRVIHAAVENPAFGKPHPHPAILDQYLTAPLPQHGPARLKGQLGVTHLEIQAQAARSVGSVLAQRALVLEIPLLDGTTTYGRLEPVDQRWTQRRRLGGQILLGIAGVAVAEADAQVHVVFRLWIPHQADEEIPGDFAFFAIDAQIGCGQGERPIIQRPGQATGTVPIVPGLGIQRCEVQAEVVAVQAQLAAGKIALNAAACVANRRNPVLRREVDPIQIGGEPQPLRRIHVRVVIEAKIAHRSAGLQRRERLGGGRR